MVSNNVMILNSIVNKNNAFDLFCEFDFRLFSSWFTGNVPDLTSKLSVKPKTFNCKTSYIYTYIWKISDLRTLTNAMDYSQDEYSQRLKHFLNSRTSLKKKHTSGVMGDTIILKNGYTVSVKGDCATITPHCITHTNCVFQPSSNWNCVTVK